MSNEFRDRWSQKKCPFGAGDESGKCCTEECAAWREWDTRETVTDERVEESWEDSKPGWFSDWKVVDTKTLGGFYYRDDPDDEGKGGGEKWAKETKQYLWRKVTTSERDVGSAGGQCRRMQD